MYPKRKYLLLRVTDRVIALAYLATMGLIRFQKITLPTVLLIFLPLPYFNFKLFFPQPEDKKWHTILTIILIHMLFLLFLYKSGIL